MATILLFSVSLSILFQQSLLPLPMSSADMNTWTCGLYTFTDTAYQKYKELGPACLEDCSDSAAGLALPTQYYWTASDWSTCSAACDGGVQTRSLACMNSLDSLCGPTPSYFPHTVLHCRLRHHHAPHLCPAHSMKHPACLFCMSFTVFNALPARSQPGHEGPAEGTTSPHVPDHQAYL